MRRELLCWPPSDEETYDLGWQIRARFTFPHAFGFAWHHESELESALRELLDYPFPYGMYEEWRREGTVRSAEAMDAHSRRVAAARALLAPTQSGSTQP